MARMTYNQHTWDNEVTLIDRRYAGQDPIGNAIYEDIETTILCNITEIGRRDHYAAGVDRLTGALVLEVHAVEYNDETQVRIDSQLCTKERSWTRPGGEIVELTVRKELRDG